MDAPVVRYLAEIPSPTQGVWELSLGSLTIPVRAYALCIVLGIVVACIVTEIRMRRRGVVPFAVLDIAVWAVPMGIIGARLYHVITSPSLYFGENGTFTDAIKIWQGGLGIWGGVAGGTFGAWIAARRLGIPLTLVAESLAPGLPLAQAIGRFGNWFNNELYGRETDLPWALRIYNWDPAEGKALVETGTGEPIVRGLFHPTFLYEALWCVGIAIAIFALDRKYRFGKGRAFALYVMLYCVGRFWIELLRVDDAEEILGLRINNWTSVLVFAGALVYFLRVRGDREEVVVGEDGQMTLVGGSSDPVAEDEDVADDEDLDDDGEDLEDLDSIEADEHENDDADRERASAATDGAETARPASSA